MTYDPRHKGLAEYDYFAYVPDDPGWYVCCEAWTCHCTDSSQPAFNRTVKADARMMQGHRRA